MMFSETSARGAVLASLAGLALVSAAGAARAQRAGPDPTESYRVLAERRMELSERAVTEPQRRRFEEGKTNTRFPSDEERRGAGKPGVLRAVSPEEKKALDHTEKGLGLFARQKYEAAIREYEAALRLSPGLTAAHNNLGSALFGLGRFEEAAASFARAVKLDPRYGQAHFNLALTHLKLGREREANASLMDAVRAFFETGDLHLREGRLEEAAAAYRELLRIDPEYPPARLRLGLVHNAERRFGAAVEELRKAAAAPPQAALAHEGLAEAFYGLGKHAEAVAAADRAVALQATRAGAHYIAGLAHVALGQRQQALARHAKLRELESDGYAQLLLEHIEKKLPAGK